MPSHLASSRPGRAGAAAPRAAMIALLCTASSLSACAMGTVGASDANLALAKDKAAMGAKAYAANCSKCHGDRGQGRNAPQLLGAGGLPKYPRDKSGGQQFTDPAQIEQQVQTRAPGTPSREAFNHAGDLFDYVSSTMPPGKARGSLKSEEYWAIVNFMLRAHGAKVPEGGVTPQNATSVTIDPE